MSAQSCKPLQWLMAHLSVKVSSLNLPSLWTFSTFGFSASRCLQGNLFFRILSVRTRCLSIPNSSHLLCSLPSVWVLALAQWSQCMPALSLQTPSHLSEASLLLSLIRIPCVNGIMNVFRVLPCLQTELSYPFVLIPSLQRNHECSSNVSLQFACTHHLLCINTCKPTSYKQCDCIFCTAQCVALVTMHCLRSNLSLLRNIPVKSTCYKIKFIYEIHPMICSITRIYSTFKLTLTSQCEGECDAMHSVWHAVMRSSLCVINSSAVRQSTLHHKFCTILHEFRTSHTCSVVIGRCRTFG